MKGFPPNGDLMDDVTVRGEAAIDIAKTCRIKLGDQHFNC